MEMDRELQQIETWLTKGDEDFDDWDWDGQTLSVFTKDDPTKHYSREDLIEQGVINE